MGCRRVLSRVSTLAKKIKVVHRSRNANETRSADATYCAPSYQFGLPLEIWLAIIDILASQDGSQRHLVPLTLVCKDLNHVAEDALYRRVSVGPRLHKLHAFLRSVCESDRRAAAVRALWMQVPGVALDSVRSAGEHKLPGNSTYTPAGFHYAVDASRMDHLADMIVQTFGRLRNLKELTYNDLQTLPEVFTSSSFHLTDFKTTGDALSKATSQLYSHTLNDPEDSPSPLVSVEKLTVDLFNPSIHLPDLRLLSVTHLFLDRCFFLSLPDLRDSLASLPNLISLRITWSAVPTRYGVSALWPTHILRGVSVPQLRRLELCEGKTQRAFEPLVRVDLDAKVQSHLMRIKDACPNITSLVWLPSEYHRQLTTAKVGRSRFCRALRRYTEGLFAVWPTLESFERAKLEGDGGFRAFVRREEGGVSDKPSEYYEEGWRQV
ncbi:hypothetical protein L227DRAFT_617502 [Lentinus tigrinus ALCF2SS1-6]|uniref:Uncharacterized protein n=1 Tax=Lentinus tigrinus ALCF2SS1-6 TaxID=1328759 RepID=A0A5C2RPF8_9APHY|nr:hypothetical protein L227DRAFT_617502 [Lentinus tigrinus ALCF2SS1-6]